MDDSVSSAWTPGHRRSKRPRVAPSAESPTLSPSLPTLTGAGAPGTRSGLVRSRNSQGKRRRTSAAAAAATAQGSSSADTATRAYTDGASAARHAAADADDADQQSLLWEDDPPLVDCVNRATVALTQAEARRGELRAELEKGVVELEQQLAAARQRQQGQLAEHDAAIAERRKALAEAEANLTAFRARLACEGAATSTFFLFFWVLDHFPGIPRLFAPAHAVRNALRVARA